MMNDYTNNQTFRTGDRVEFHPGTDLWARGAKFGEVLRALSVGRLRVRVDATQQTVTTTVQSVRHSR